MLELNNNNKKTWHHYGQKVSQKLTDLTYQAHHHKIIFHNKEEEPVIKFPLLLGITITLIVPVIASLALVSLLVTDHNLIVEKEER